MREARRPMGRRIAFSEGEVKRVFGKEHGPQSWQPASSSIVLDSPGLGQATCLVEKREDRVHRFSQINTDGRAKRGGADWGEERRDAIRSPCLLVSPRSSPPPHLCPSVKSVDLMLLRSAASSGVSMCSAVAAREMPDDAGRRREERGSRPQILTDSHRWKSEARRGRLG